MLLFLCKLFESQKLDFYKTQGWEKKSGFFRARVRVSMCAPTHIRTHRHTAMSAHSILNWLNTPRQAQGVSQFNFELSSPHQWRINDFYKNFPSKILLFHAKALTLQCLKISRYDMPHLRKRVRLLYRYMLIIILYYIELLHRVGNRKLSRRFAKALDNP